MVCTQSDSLWGFSIDDTQALNERRHEIENLSFGYAYDIANKLIDNGYEVRMFMDKSKSREYCFTVIASIIVDNSEEVKGDTE